MPQVLEPGLVVWNRLAECSETGRQNFDALKIRASFFERAIEFALYPVNCRIRTHKQPILLWVKAMPWEMVPTLD